MARRPVKNAPRSFQRAWDFDDEWSDAAHEKAARAMVAWLKGSVNTKRAINSLSLPELKGLASAAIHQWIVEASERIQTDHQDANKLKELLL